MLLSRLPPFQRLPLEMRIEVFLLLGQEDLKKMRLVERTTDHAIRYGRLGNFEECRLSDDTAKYVLNSRSKVHSVEIRNMLLPRWISAKRGTVLQYAREIIIGEKILPENLEKILQQVGNVRTLWFDEPDKNALKGFLRSTATFKYLTTLEIFIGIKKFESEFMWALANEEREDFKFPSLKELNFSWNQTYDLLDDRYSCWWIYFALHKLLWIHRATVISIEWSLELEHRPRSLETQFPGDPKDPKIISKALDYADLRARLPEVTRLKHVHLSQIHWEGHPYWNLNSPFLESQTELTQFSLKCLAFNASEVMTIETVAIKNASSLIKMELGLLRPFWRIVCYNMPNLGNCHALQDLRITYFPYNPLTFVDTIPTGLTHLSITNGIFIIPHLENQGFQLQPEHYEPVNQWIVNNLQGLKSLNMLAGYSLMALIPNWETRNTQDCRIFMNRLRHLERLSIEFFKFFLHRMTPVLNARIAKEGVVLEVENDINSPDPAFSCSALHCNIDRSTFTPYPMD